MSETHTRGPWVVAEKSGVVICAGDDPANPGRILFVLRDPIGTSETLPTEELEANAHLCAAAPYLLKALKEISDQYENCDLNHVDFRVGAKTVADAAIALASVSSS